MPPKEWVVDQIFGQGDLGVIYGPPGCGKTFVVIDFILKLCSGKRWAHRFEVKRPLNIAYCAGEGHGALPDRFRTAVKHQNITTSLNNFTYFKTVPQLFDETNPDHILKFITFMQRDGKKLDLLVIDTLITACAGADENSAQDMRKIIQACQLAIKSLGCAILLIHHTNKNEEVERGSSALRGACDFMLRIKKESPSGTTATLECSKSKDGESWQSQNFNLCTIEGFNSVHVAWDIIGSHRSNKESKESLKIRILETFTDFPNDKFTCKALAITINQDENFTNRLLNNLIDEGKCIRTKDGNDHRKNPWLYSLKI